MKAFFVDSLTLPFVKRNSKEGVETIFSFCFRSRELQKKSRKRKHCNNNGSSTHSEEIGAEKNVPLLEPDSPCATEAADGRNGHPADTNGDVTVLQKPPPPPANLGGHRAGFDAFMTGFAFTTFLVHQTQIPLAPASFAAGDIKAEHLVNRIYLVCKEGA